MQSTVKVACLAALLLTLVVRPAAQAQQTAHTTHPAAQHAVAPLLAEDGSKTGTGGG